MLTHTNCVHRDNVLTNIFSLMCCLSYMSPVVNKRMNDDCVSFVEVIRKLHN